MSGVEVSDAVARLLAACESVAEADLGLLDTHELWAFLDGIETVARRLPSQTQRGLARLQVETDPRALGAKTWNEVLRTRWRLSTGEAGRRLAETADLAPRQPVTGPALAPSMPAIAAAQAGGFLSAEQVRFLRDTLNNDLPGWVDAITRSQIEVDLVRFAVGQGYDALRRATKTRLTLLDQDGPDPEAVERERRRGRGARKGRQGPDGLTALTVTMDPETAAMVEVLFAKFAAPGMCNPDDEQPCYSGTPSQAQIDDDHRTPAQRQHDALKVVWRIALMTDLGTLNGLPVSIIIRTTLQDLEARGIAITGGGTVLSMDDVDRLGGHAGYHLCVFDGKTGSALNHFRSKRVATAAQRVVLIAQHGVGCTKPGCTVDTYGVQAHHAVTDWADLGNTNVDDLAPACGGDNRMVGPGGWTTRINEHGECEWIPPEHLDTGQDRTNILHRPEALLAPPDNEEPKPDNGVEPRVVDVEDSAVIGSEETAEPFDPWPLDDVTDEPDPETPWVNDHTDTPAPQPTSDDAPYSPWADIADDDTADDGPTGEAQLRQPIPHSGDETEPVLDQPVAVVPPMIVPPDEPIPYILTDDIPAPPAHAAEDPKPFDPWARDDTSGPDPPTSNEVA